MKIDYNIFIGKLKVDFLDIFSYFLFVGLIIFKIFINRLYNILILDKSKGISIKIK